MQRNELHHADSARRAYRAFGTPFPDDEPIFASCYGADPVPVQLRLLTAPHERVSSRTLHEGNTPQWRPTSAASTSVDWNREFRRPDTGPSAVQASPACWSQYRRTVGRRRRSSGFAHASTRSVRRRLLGARASPSLRLRPLPLRARWKKKPSTKKRRTRSVTKNRPMKVMTNSKKRREPPVRP